jgi:spoIIIJ-associated protein
LSDDASVEAVSVEATGETVGEAKWKALRDLERVAPGLDKASVRFQVVSEGERGLLGVGYTPARVIATVSAAAARPRVEARPGESGLESRMRTLVQTVVGAMGIAARVDVHETDDGVVVTCSGGDLGLLIGKHGQTIDALQYVANAASFRSGAGKPVTIDAAGYRERRRATLEGIALRAAEQAAAGERVSLEPMTAVERKVVHERLKDVVGVETSSEGTEPNRYVVVSPA